MIMLTHRFPWPRRRPPAGVSAASDGHPIQSAEHLLAIITSAGLGVWSLNVLRRECEWSPVCGELFGAASPAGSTQEQWLDRVHADDRAAVCREVERAVRHRDDFNCDYRVVWPDGSNHWLTSFARPVLTPAGDVAGLEGFVREITLRKTAEALATERNRQLHALHERLAQRAVDAETAVRAKDAFLRNVSHELRTPLNHILGGVDVLRIEPHGSEQEPWLDIISRSGKHLLEMIEQLIVTSQAEAGASIIEKRSFSLRTMLREAVATLASRAIGKKVRFDIQLDQALPNAVVGDPTLIAQALLNYLNNAVKFAPPDSAVRVTAAATSFDDERLTVRFEVRDGGPGVTDEVRAVLFSEFDCDDSAVHRLHGGLGIGLAHTRKIVKQMGGEVGFSSEAGRGATFWLSVPLERAVGDRSTAT